MKKLFCGIFLTLFITSHVSAQEVKAVTVDVLAKTSSSWDGGNLPEYSKVHAETSSYDFYQLQMPAKNSC